MKPEQKAAPKSFNYGAGALVVIVAALGAAAIAYSLPVLAFNLFNLPAWIFGPLGLYTLVYALIARRNSTYYLVWGSMMLAIALVSTLYTVVNPFVIVGILAIVIAIIGIVAYQRSKK